MARQLRPVDLEFVESAPLRLVFSAQLSASPGALYTALADDVAGWPDWFTAVTAARPVDDGAGREIRLKGGTVFTETVLARVPDARYAYRVDQTNAPGLRALLEEWRITPTANGSRVQWTFAADGPAPLRIALRLGRPGLGRAFRDAVRNLDRRLARSPGR
ncbi:SRPBCC family protein [Streptomyces peucetius]|uniref:SRPBCC family protein n=1 Tax=Streptomyces peucetius TaxID=1950 RepID=A0ABY6I4A6_STRPE|nr:SRPBCC family protein [Streptomyces peucetius]UYQ60722.1 SRPBCC family protein [Streptomyces peucetius]